MSYKILNNRGDWLVQLQRDGRRKTKRGTGGEAEAKKAEALLIAELEEEIKLEEAKRMLGIEHVPRGKGVPTLLEFFEKRWVEHAKVVQNESSRRISRGPFNYLLFYLGNKRLDELLRAEVINGYVESMKTNGTISFTKRQDGKPRRPRTAELTNATINKGLQCLRALLNLAHAEGVIAQAPRIDALPTDNSTPVIPPTEEQYAKLLAVSADFRDVAPLLPEVTEFTAETGLRRSEIFHLTWRSVDLERDAIRVEMQVKVRMVNGRAWRPKHNKWREIPLSARAKAILLARQAAGPADADAHVFPNRGGAPYDRLDRAAEASGKGYFFDAVEAAGLKGKVTFHGLRHLFAVRLLTRGAPITIVSELLGHSDINLTVKRYGRFASDAKVKWAAIRVLDRDDKIPDAT